MQTISPAPSIRRRISVIMYEMLILVGVWALGYLVPSLILGVAFKTQVPNWLAFAHVYILFGVYFTWYWTHGGQTLPMKTWNIRLVDRHDLPVTWKRALARYALCWLWFLPGLAAARFLGAQGWTLLGLPAINIVLWAAASRLHPEHQFVHDRLAGTRLVTVPTLSSIQADESIAYEEK